MAQYRALPAAGHDGRRLDQVLVLVRLLDNENVDPAILNREVFYFIRTIRSMFNDRHCLHNFGYTSMMLGTLKQVHLGVAGSRPT